MSLDWFWIMWYSLLGLVVVLFWIAEFSGMRLGKKNKKKSMWQESKDRIYQQQQYGGRTYRKGM